jgi:NAD(P)-dependent dehydrogenase (short-subunit alcohol dehydrogenase family)
MPKGDEMTGMPIASAKEILESAVIIVGGTSGVGLAAARQFAEAGARGVALIGRNAERGARAVAAVRETSPDVKIVFSQGDSIDVASATTAFERAREALGGVDVLINTTAASYVPKLLFRTELADIEPMLVQQALAPMIMSRLALPHMREQKSGVIINVASDAAKVPTPGESVIGAAMAAIVVFSRTLAIEAKRDGVRVNVLTPSLIGNTDVYDRVMSDPFSAKLFSNAAKLAHLGVAQPEDLAAMMVFLASPAAARLTGQAISINGGISAA